MSLEASLARLEVQMDELTLFTKRTGITLTPGLGKSLIKWEETSGTLEVWSVLWDETEERYVLDRRSPTYCESCKR